MNPFCYRKKSKTGKISKIFTGRSASPMLLHDFYTQMTL